ncbi:MAG: helix-turn-helix transcriptional regulator [Bacteroidota bacterium]
MKTYQELSELLSALRINAPLRDRDFFIFKIEDHFGDQAIKVAPYRHHFYELSFGFGHDVDCKVGTVQFKALDAVLSFNAPFQLSSWKINSFREDSLGYMLFFKAQLFESAFSSIKLSRKFPFLNRHTTPMIVLSEEQKTIVIDLMQKLHAEYQNHQPRHGNGIFIAYLLVLLEKLKHFFGGDASKYQFASRLEEITFLFENLLKDQVVYGRKIETYASQLHISQAYLSEAVKAITGQSPLAIIQTHVILQAKEWLRHSNRSITDIALELGFNDASNFIKYFKKYVQITPNAFRRNP